MTVVRRIGAANVVGAAKAIGNSGFSGGGRMNGRTEMGARAGLVLNHQMTDGPTEQRSDDRPTGVITSCLARSHVNIHLISPTRRRRHTTPVSTCCCSCSVPCPHPPGGRDTDRLMNSVAAMVKQTVGGAILCSGKPYIVKPYGSYR